MSQASSTCLPYHEPAIMDILILASFFLLLNVLNHVLDALVYCRILSQVALGIAWGTPGGKWLAAEAEQIITSIGYLGLISLVYEDLSRP